MTLPLDTLFRVLNGAVLPAWALLVFAPRWAWTRRLVHSGLVPALYGAAYVALIAVTFATGAVPEGAGADTLGGVVQLFSSPALALVGWVHYLCFDLFVGAWMGRDAQRLGLPHLAVGPRLVATLFYGPAGLLAYLVLRAAMRKATTLEEPAAARA